MESRKSNNIVILSNVKLPSIHASVPSEPMVSLKFCFFIVHNSCFFVLCFKISCNNNNKKKKKTHCKFCLNFVTNFERHLERNHSDSKEVIDMLSYPKRHSERKNILCLIRNSGNFNEFLKGKIYPKYGRIPDKTEEYYPCSRCKALLKKKILIASPKKMSVK